MVVFESDSSELKLGSLDISAILLILGILDMYTFEPERTSGYLSLAGEL